jgi:hypothetical protein
MHSGKSIVATPRGSSASPIYLKDAFSFITFSLADLCRHVSARFDAIISSSRDTLPRRKILVFNARMVSFYTQDFSDLSVPHSPK